MKKILKLSLVCAVLFSGLSTYAIDGNEDFNLHVLKLMESLLRLLLTRYTKLTWRYTIKTII